MLSNIIRMGTLLVIMVLVTAEVAAKDDAFRIGGVVALSGTYGVIGEETRKGAELAIEVRGGKVLGVPIQAIWEDSETKPQIAVQKATIVISKGAHMLLGATASGETLAVMKQAELRKIPMLVTVSADDDVTGKLRNRYTFRTSNDAASEVKMIIEYLRQSKYKKIYGVAADYGTTRDMLAAVKAGLEKDATYVGEDFPPFGSKDYAIIINRIVSSGADAAVIITGGSDSITFMKQSEEIKLREKVKFVGAILSDEALAKAAGPGSLGSMSAVRYHFSLDTPANKDFVTRFKAKYGEYPTPFAGETYDGLSWWLDMVEKTGVWDREKWIDAFETSVRENSLEGRKIMRACDHQAQQIGIFAETVKGQAPLPEYTMKIRRVFKAEEIARPCP